MTGISLSIIAEGKIGLRAVSAKSFPIRRSRHKPYNRTLGVLRVSGIGIMD